LTGAGFGSWTNPRVFSIRTPERSWLRTEYSVDSREHPLPAEKMKFSVFNDIRFTTTSGQTTVDQHSEDASPGYGGPGSILDTKLGLSASGRGMPIAEILLNEGGALTWSAGFRFPGDGPVSYEAGGTFQVSSDTPATPNSPAAPAAEGPAKAGGGAADQPAAKGTPLPKSPATPKAPPKLVGEIQGLTDAVREATEIAKKTFLIGKLRDKLAEAQPFLPPGEAKKLIDEALDSLANEGVKQGIMKILEILAGKSATTMPEDRNPKGPNVPEGVPGQNIQKGPKIPLDFGVERGKQLSFEYKNGLRKSYTAGEAMKFTIVPPYYLDSLQGNKRVVIVAAAEARQDNARPIGNSFQLNTSTTQEITLTAPSEPGKYVVRVDVGMETQNNSAQEFEVTAGKK
jgi:hypothetical protein